MLKLRKTLQKIHNKRKAKRRERKGKCVINGEQQQTTSMSRAAVGLAEAEFMLFFLPFS